MVTPASSPHCSITLTHSESSSNCGYGSHTANVPSPAGSPEQAADASAAARRAVTRRPVLGERVIDAPSCK